MTEQQILDGIRATTDQAALSTQLQRVHQMQDHLNALRSGEAQASKEWVNSSQLLFPEDFEEEMNNLTADLAPIENLLGQLDRIELALKMQIKKVSSVCDVCGEPATNEAFEIAKVPAQGGEKVSTGKVFRGCDRHPASQRAKK